MEYYEMSMIRDWYIGSMNVYPRYVIIVETRWFRDRGVLRCYNYCAWKHKTK